MYPKKDSYSTRECKNKGIKNISFLNSQYIDLSFLECTAFHNDRILIAKTLSLILDDLNRTLVCFYMSILKEYETVSSEKYD